MVIEVISVCPIFRRVHVFSTHNYIYYNSHPTHINAKKLGVFKIAYDRLVGCQHFWLKQSNSIVEMSIFHELFVKLPLCHTCKEEEIILSYMNRLMPGCFIWKPKAWPFIYVCAKVYGRKHAVFNNYWPVVKGICRFMSLTHNNIE